MQDQDVDQSYPCQYTYALEFVLELKSHHGTVTEFLVLSKPNDSQINSCVWLYGKYNYKKTNAV